MFYMDSTTSGAAVVCQTLRLVLMETGRGAQRAEAVTSVQAETGHIQGQRAGRTKWQICDLRLSHQ